MARTSQDAINEISRQLSSRGMSIEDAQEWNADLAEDGRSIVVIASAPGYSAVTGIDWPFGEETAEVICAEIRRRNR